MVTCARKRKSELNAHIRVLRVELVSTRLYKVSVHVDESMPSNLFRFKHLLSKHVLHTSLPTRKST